MDCRLPPGSSSCSCLSTRPARRNASRNWSGGRGQRTQSQTQQNSSNSNRPPSSDPPYKGQCTACGKIGKGYVPAEFSTGFGPRFSTLVAEIGGIDGNSRETIQSFCSSVLGVPISLGAVQKIIDRASAAIKPHYESIKDKARCAKVNHLDETAWKSSGKLHWLWVMASPVVAFFMIHTNRSQAAFAELIGAWEGILVSDGYRLYQNWVHQRQTCLAHLIRRAKGLAERTDPELAKCGAWARDELRKLCKMAKDPPTKAEWRAFYARLCRLIALYRDSDSEAGTFVRHIENEMDSLEERVSPTKQLRGTDALFCRSLAGTQPGNQNNYGEVACNAL